MRFDRICRDNAIAHRLTQPASPTTTGKIQRFHLTLRRELLDDADPFTGLAAAQTAVDAWVAEYNTLRPHQALDMACPADRFTPIPLAERQLLPLRLPATLTSAPPPAPEPQPQLEPTLQPQLEPVSEPGAVEFERIVPASGNLGVAGKQFWLGPHRAGLTVTFWADHDIIHLLIAGVRIKSLRSHLSSRDLAILAARGGRPAGPPPLPPAQPGSVVEVDRTVSRHGLVCLAGRRLLAAEILAGRRVTIRIDGSTLLFVDPDTRQLLRTKPNPLTPAQAHRLQGARPAGPPPAPAQAPIRVQRRVASNGVIMVAGQLIALGRTHAGNVVTVEVTETSLSIDLSDDTTTIRRSTTQPVRSIKAHRPRHTHVSSPTCQPSPETKPSSIKWDLKRAGLLSSAALGGP